MATELRNELVFDALKQPLALIDNDERRRAIETYVEAARTPLERAMYDLMSQMAVAIEEQVKEHYKIRLTYTPGGLNVEVEAKTPAAGEEQAWSTSEGDVEKITIRIPAELKDLAQQAASRAGTSANTWFVKALARAVRNIEVQSGPPSGDKPRPSDKRRGFGVDIGRDFGRDLGRDLGRDSGRDSGRGSRLSGWVGGDDE
jgi:hypothetical protein